MIYVLILLAAASRLVPHPPNFAPMGAIGLFAGAYLHRRTAWLVPILALLASDFILGAYRPVTMAFVYGGFVLGGVLGRVMLSRRQSALLVGGAAVAHSVLFFILSNFGTWLPGGLYPRSLAGLMECYVAAIPFFGNTLASDLIFSAVLFGGYALVRRLAGQRTVDATA